MSKDRQEKARLEALLEPLQEDLVKAEDEDLHDSLKSNNLGMFHLETSARFSVMAGSHALLSVNELQEEVNKQIEEEAKL